MADTEKTSTIGEIVGSPYDMTPEQIRGEAIGFPSDVYQLGLVLYRTLSGRHPFEQTSTMEVIFKQLNQRPELSAPQWSGLPRFLRFGLQKALEKSPGRRFPDAGAMAGFFRRGTVSLWRQVHDAVRRGRLKWALAFLALAAVAVWTYQATFGSRVVHSLHNSGSRLEARNRFGVRLWRKDFSPFSVYLAYSTRSEPPESLGAGSQSLDSPPPAIGRPPGGLGPPDLARAVGLSARAIHHLSRPVLPARHHLPGGEVLLRGPFLVEHEYEAYDYIRVVKPNTVKLLGESANGEREALITLQQFQSMYPCAMVFLRGVKKYVFTHPGTFEVFPQAGNGDLSVFMLFGVNNLFAHMTFVAEIGFHTANGDDKVIKGIPNVFPDLRSNIPFEDKLFILPAGGHLVANRWHDQGWVRFRRVRPGERHDLDRAGRLTVHTKSRTLTYWDPPDTLRRVYTLVNASYQERMKKRNVGHALDLVRQALVFPVQNPYLRSALLYLQGDLEVRMGRYREGEKSLLRAMELYPGNNDASERLCEMDMLQGDPQSALLRLAGTYADSSEFWGFSSFGVKLFKGYVFLHMGMFSKARDEFEKIRIHLPSLAALCQAANDLFNGDYAAALAAARGLELKPLEAVDLRELRLLLGRSLLLNDTDYARARFLFDDIFRNSLEFGHLAEISTWYLVARGGRISEARQNASEAFARLQARARGDFMTRLWLFYDAYVFARTMELAGDRVEAARGYRACIEANPHAELAARSRQRLALLERRR